MNKYDEDFPDWLKKMADEGRTLYDNDYTSRFIDDEDVADEGWWDKLDDDYHVSFIVELYDASGDFICEIEREDVGIMCQNELDEIVERIKDENYLESAQKEIFDFIGYKVIDVYFLFEKRSHDQLVIFFQHKVEKL